jgi:hypothetical protein
MSCAEEELVIGHAREASIGRKDQATGAETKQAAMRHRRAAGRRGGFNSSGHKTLLAVAANINEVILDPSATLDRIHKPHKALDHVAPHL